MVPKEEKMREGVSTGTLKGMAWDLKTSIPEMSGDGLSTLPRSQPRALGLAMTCEAGSVSS